MYLYKAKGFMYTGSLVSIRGFNVIPDWVIHAYQVGTLFYDTSGRLFLKTIDRDIPVNVGDCIVSDEDGVLSVIPK